MPPLSSYGRRHVTPSSHRALHLLGKRTNHCTTGRHQIHVCTCCCEQFFVDVRRERNTARMRRGVHARKTLGQLREGRQVDDDHRAGLLHQLVHELVGVADSAHVESLDQLESTGGHEVATGKEDELGHAQHLPTRMSE